MGKTWKKGRRNKNGEPPKKRPNTQGVPGDWKEIDKSCPQFEKYYQELGIIPEDEWSSFMEHFRADLPATFRIINSRGDSQSMSEILQNKYFSKLDGITVNGKPAPLPQVLTWYPNRLAWQLNMSRAEIRYSAEYLSLHQFLVAEAEKGSVARQEAVSMIPPLLLDAQPHHNILDMCAAPGSKTLQILEAVTSTEGVMPTGVVIANDGDYKRCHMLVTQTKRFNNPAYMITNEDATRFPNLKVLGPGDKTQVLKFDRILCDVPCTGDGTLRKNYAIWGKWSQAQALGIHKLQRRILLRGMDMLKPGGRLVYSTCSLNPIENEATVLSALRDRPEFRLLPTEGCLEGLKRVEGMTNWRVMHSSGTWYNKFEEVEDRHRKAIAPTMFSGDAAVHNLQYCMRVYPHLQNTGGFFICILEKQQVEERTQVKASEIETIADLPDKTENKDENENEESKSEEAKTKENDDDSTECKPNIHKDTNVLVDKMKWKNFQGYREDPFIFLKPDASAFDSLKDFYGLSGKNFPFSNIYVRSQETKQRNLSVTGDTIKQIIELNTNRIKVIQCGLKLFSYCKEEFSPCNYRLLQEGVHFTSRFMSQKVFQVTEKDMGLVLSGTPTHKTELEPEIGKSLLDMPKGIVVFSLAAEGIRPTIMVTVYSTVNHVKSYITEEEKNHYRILLGLEPLVTKREEKKLASLQYHQQKREETAKRIAAEKAAAELSEPAETVREEGDETVNSVNAPETIIS